MNILWLKVNKIIWQFYPCVLNWVKWRKSDWRVGQQQVNGVSGKKNQNWKGIVGFIVAVNCVSLLAIVHQNMLFHYPIRSYAVVYMHSSWPKCEVWIPSFLTDSSNAYPIHRISHTVTLPESPCDYFLYVGMKFLIPILEHHLSTYLYQRGLGMLKHALNWNWLFNFLLPVSHLVFLLFSSLLFCPSPILICSEFIMP